MLTNSMEALDDKKKLGANDFVSFRVVEDRDDESQRLRVNDNGELEVPYIGPVPAQGKTCKQLARDIKARWRKNTIITPRLFWPSIALAKNREAAFTFTAQ